MSRPKQHYGKWRIRWTDEHGVRQSETFDKREDAVFALSKHELETKEIRRGLRSPLPPDKSVADLCDYYETNRAPLKRSGKDDLSIIRCHIRKELGSVRLRALTVAHTDALAAKRAHLDKKTLHNILTLLITLLNVAVDLNWRQSSKSAAAQSREARPLQSESQWMLREGTSNPAMATFQADEPDPGESRAWLFEGKVCAGDGVELGRAKKRKQANRLELVWQFPRRPARAMIAFPRFSMIASKLHRLAPLSGQ